MFKRFSFFALVLFFLTTSLAFSDEAPTIGFRAPFYSVAFSDDASALMFNPAGLGWKRGTQFLYLHSYSDSTFKGNNGFFLSGGNAAFAAEWLGYEKDIKYRKYSLAFGFEIMPRLYFGSSYSWFGSKIKEYDDLSSWRVGLLARPCAYFSLGAVAKDLNRPTFLGEKIEVGYDLGIAVRPLTDRVTFFLDGSLKDKQKLEQGGFRYGAQVEITDGLILSGDMDNDGNFGVNLRLNFPNLSFGSYNHFDKNDGFQKGTAYLNFSGDRYRTVIQKKNRFLEVRLSGEIAEEKRKFIFGPSKDSVLDILMSFKKAKVDKSIQGMILRIESVDVGWSKLQEIRAAILDFKSSGKKVICFMEFAGDREYYLASAGDKIVMLSGGYLLLDGLASEVTFIKGTLEKLGIKADLEHIGDYKSASDLVTRESMSDAHREVVNSLLDDLYAQFTEGIASGRGWSVSDVKSKIDSGPYTAPEALKANLVDNLSYYDDWEKIAEEMEGKRPGKICHKKYSEQKEYKYSWAIPPKIAVVYGVGAIFTGESGSDILFGKTMGSETIARAIKKAREDRSVKAVVFRVDSPGGDGMASEVIWHEVVLTKEKKPVIVSMSDVAGSGGYYVACAADTILAMPGTYTGSIGVITGKVDLSGLYEKIGFSKETVKRGKHADFFTLTREFDDEERKIVRRQLREFYDDFVDKVAEGRGKSYEEIDEIARGRVWTGNQARQNGLVDELGGLKKAIQIAKEKAGIPEDKEVELVLLPEKPWSLGLGFPLGFNTSTELERTIEQIKKLEKLNRERIWYLMDYEIDTK
jgi:protease-4